MRLFSFWGDTALAPFCGTGTTMLAAMKCGRNSIGIEIDEDYCHMALNPLKTKKWAVPTEMSIEFSREGDNGRNFVVQEGVAGYKVREKKKTSKRKM